ncbi:MAG: glycosyltransferase family 4 protein [Bacilli bacterium]|jgi:glycosyltransferase involved in cell wall biosynthesis
MDKKLRILHVIPSLEVGGAEMFVANLCAAFDFSKCDVTILVFKSLSNSRTDDILRDTPVKVIFLDKKPGFSFQFNSRFKKTIHELKPDIINAHLHTIYYVHRYAMDLHVPIFYTIHSINNVDLRPLYRKIIKKDIRNERIIPIGISSLVSNSVCQLYSIPNCPTIFNGIALPKIELNAMRKYDFVHVGRLTAVKNQKMLLDAFNIVYKQNPSLQLLIIGRGELYNDVCSHVSKLECARNVSIINDCDEPSSYLDESKIFVLSSLYEGNPISILEAMSHGLPIISTDVGGVSDVVEDRKNGFLVPSDNVAALSRAMTELIASPTTMVEFSRNNLFLIKEFDIKKTAQYYFELYLLHMKRGS